MLDRLNDYNWEEAFVVATSNINPVINYKGSLEKFTREDVDFIIGMDDGENDGPDWIGIFKLKDERYVFVSAGCDYTGWDCQAGGQTWVSDNLDDLHRFGMSHESQNRLDNFLLSYLAGIEENK